MTARSNGRPRKREQLFIGFALAGKMCVKAALANTNAPCNVTDRCALKSPFRKRIERGIE